MACINELRLVNVYHVACDDELRLADTYHVASIDCNWLKRVPRDPYSRCDWLMCVPRDPYSRCDWPIRRSATGEAWQDVMLDCTDRPTVLCSIHSDSWTNNTENPALCGSTIAYPYFISFYMLCSFLVSGTSGLDRQCLR